MSAAFPDRSVEGATAFVTTDWGLVVTAQDLSPAGAEALERICQIYWQPLYAFARRRENCSAEEAQDLTQGFFALFLERRDLNAVRQEKGRLRSYLLTALKNFLSNERGRARTIKRGEGQKPLSLDGANVPADHATAEQLFERQWAMTILEQVFARLEIEYRSAGKSKLFARFKGVLGEEDRQSQAEIAEEFAMSENAVKQAFHRFRKRYREVLRDEVARTVAAPGDVEDELRYLVAVLRA